MTINLKLLLALLIRLTSRHPYSSVFPVYLYLLRVAVGPEWLRDSRFLLALFIWLIILTVFFLCLCCYVACCRGKREREAIKEAQRNSYMYGYPEILRHNSQKSNMSSRPNSKYGQMRDNGFIDYFNPTIGSQPGIRRDDSMKRPLTREDSGASYYSNYNNNSSSRESVQVHPVPSTQM